MTTPIQSSVIAGMAGTAVMTLFMFLGPFLGLPEMDPASMLADMMRIPQALGWVLHFLIGIAFATLYILMVSRWLKKIPNPLYRGVLFGLIAFVLAQIAMGVLSALFPMPPVEVNMVLMMVGSFLGHLIFGIAVVLFAKI